MIKLKILYICFFLFAAQVLSAGTVFESGAVSLAMGGVQSVAEKDVNSVFANPANMSSVEAYSLLLSYMPLYGIEGVYNVRAAGIGQFADFSFGAGIDRFSAADLLESSEIVLSSSYKKNAFSAGLSVRYIMSSLDIEADETASVNHTIQKLKINLGMSFRLNSYFLFGAEAENLNNQSLDFSDNNNSDLRIFNLGVKYNVKDNFCVMLEDEFQYMSRPVFNIGAELTFAEVVSARMGISRLSQMTLGAGLHFSCVNIDFGLKSNADLGNLYQLDVTVKYE